MTLSLARTCIAAVYSRCCCRCRDAQFLIQRGGPSSSKRLSTQISQSPNSQSRPLHASPAVAITTTDTVYTPNAPLRPPRRKRVKPVALVEDAPSHHPPITLRPYQEAAIQSCLDAIGENVTRIGVSSPTGSGKTTMFMNLIPRIPDGMKYTGKDGKRGRTLIVVSSVELARQAEGAAMRLLGKDWSVEVEQSARHASGLADVTVATYQTLLNTERLLKFDPAEFKLIIVDEAHHAAAKSYLRLLHYFHQDVQLPASVPPITNFSHGYRVPIVGFSATFSRPDQLALSAVFEKIVFHREVSAMLEDGWLSPARSTTVRAELELKTIADNALGDFSTAALARKVNTLAINELIVRSYLHRAGDRRSTLVFCVDLTHVANLCQAFRDAGIDARSVSSLTLPTVRRDTIAGFGKGDFPVLVNCEVLTEGTDIPEIDCIILARPTKSKNLLMQMVGRGLRLSPNTGKEDCFIIDIVDSTSDGLLVTPTLLGLTHDEMEMESERLEEEKGAVDETSDFADVTEKERERRDRYKVRYIDTDDPFGVAKSTKLAITKLSRHAWIICGTDNVVLDLFGGEYIQIRPAKPGSPGRLVIKFVSTKPPFYIKSSPYMSSKTVAHAEDLERAIQTGDAYAKKKAGFEKSKQLQRNALWRQRPPTEKALGTLLKMKGIKTEEGEESTEFTESTVSTESTESFVQILGKTINVSALTAGEVAAYITASKHGGFSLKSNLDKTAETKAKREAARREKRLQVRRKKMEDLPLPSS